MEVQVLEGTLQQISLKGSILEERKPKYTKVHLCVHHLTSGCFSRTLSRYVSTLNLVLVELATPT